MARTNVYRAAALCAIQASVSPSGETYADLRAATGLPERKLSGALSGLTRLALVFTVDLGKFSRYVATAALRDAGREMVLADHRRQVLENRRRNERAARERKKQLYAASPELRAADSKRRKASRDAEQAKKKAEPKPKAAKPKPFVKPSQPKPVNRAPDARKKWAEQEPIVPAHVRVQRCPGYTGVSRYRPDVGFLGEFLRAGVGRYES